MGNITDLIANIRRAVFGKDVRESIASAIEQTYEDAIAHGHTDMEVADARATSPTLRNRLEGDKADLQNQINTEKARIDNLAHLEDGSTTGDAELQDIRVAANGQVYNNAGEAVRTQIINIHSAIESRKQCLSTDLERCTLVRRRGLLL